MGRNHKPRKRYVPKHVRLDAMEHAMDRATVLSNHQRAQLVAPLQASLEAMRTGRGSMEHWMNLADGMNVAEALSQLRIGSNLVHHFTAGQAALAAVHQRHKERGSWTLRGAELTALDDATWAASVQIDYCSQGEMADAINTVKRRVSAALAGNAAPHTIMCLGMLTGHQEGQTI